MGGQVIDEQENEPSTSSRLRAFLRRWRWILILVAIVLVIAVPLALVLHFKPSSPPERLGRGGFNNKVSVSVATVTTGDIVIRIPALGTITPLTTVTVKTQISGQLQKIAFKEGQLVREGDFLAQVDPRPYEAALNQATATLHRDEALLADAELNFKRYEGLANEGTIPRQQLDTQKSQVKQYQGTVQGDLAQIKTAALNLQYTRIVAPITGRVGLRQVDQGNHVTAGDANGIVVITQLQPITAIFSVPEDNVAAIVGPMQKGVTLQVEAYDRSNSTKLADGKLLSFDNQIDAATGTIKLRAQFDNKDGLLFPNQFVNIRLLANVLHDQVIMPNAAVHRGAPNGVVSAFVYLVNSDNTVAVRPVVLGTVDGERVAVTSGLAAGDVVVIEGGDRLRDGAEILLPSANPMPTPAAGQRKPGAKPRMGDGSRRPRQRPGNAP